MTCGEGIIGCCFGISTGAGGAIGSSGDVGMTGPGTGIFSVTRLWFTCNAYRQLHFRHSLGRGYLPLQQPLHLFYFIECNYADYQSDGPAHDDSNKQRTNKHIIPPSILFSP